MITEKFWIATSFPAIGNEKYPMYHDDLQSALATAHQIRNISLSRVRIVLQQKIEIENEKVLFEWK
jgi:hypothetical protein